MPLPDDVSAAAPIVGRLAPSPTGLLHLGHARSFLVAWWYARSRGGRVVLRMEDLDGPRVIPEMRDAALRDLEWLGLDWDGPVRVQSDGIAELRTAAQRMLDDGLAYPCTCSRAEIRRAMSAPHGHDGETAYPGTCRGRYASIDEAERSTGREAGLRFRAPPGLVHVEDLFVGPRTFDVAVTSGDFLVARRDKTPAYQLAVVLDDAASQVTEVVRGDDLLPSAARQQLLQAALGLPTPAWVHVPLVTDVTGMRLAKRTDAASLAALRTTGRDPRAVVAWAARTSGMACGTRVGAAEALREFDLAAVPRTSVVLTESTLAELLAAR